MLNLRGGAHKRLRGGAHKRLRPAANMPPAVLYARLSGFYSSAISSVTKYRFLI